MGSFYDDASWLLVPSGIEEDIVFAQKPISGLGDLTFTRASDATYTDSTGVVRRSPYNMIRNSTMVGAVAGTPGTIPTNWDTASIAGLTRTVVGIGTESGLPYIDLRFAGTATSSIVRVSSEAVNQIAATNGQTWASSSYMRRISGTYDSSSIGFVLRNSAFASLGALLNSATLTTTLQRFVLSATTNNASVAFVQPCVDFNVTIGQTYDFTIRIAAPQMVEGSQALDFFPTSDRLNVPRIDFRNADGTLSSCGRLLLEPQRTNSIRNSSMVGAVAGSPGTLPTNWGAPTGLTQTVIGIGVENGLPYIDIRYNGTSTVSSLIIALEANNSIAASNAQTWTNSIYFKTVAQPTPPNTFGLLTVQRAFGVNVASSNLVFTPSTTLARYTQTTTTNQPTITHIQPYFLASLTVGETYDFTIRIAAPQMELGAYATTWVPTTTAAVTRLADTFTRNNIFTNGLISAAGGTWIVDLSNNLSLTRDSIGALWIGDNSTAGTLGNAIAIRNGGTARLSIGKTVAGTFTSLFTTTTDRCKIAIKWNGTTADIFVNGVKQVSATSFTTTNMQFLYYTTVVALYLDQSFLAPSPLSDAQCIQLTTL